MEITIVGAGNTARGIATPALTGRHTVTVTAKDPGKAVRLVDEPRGQATGEGRIAEAVAPGTRVVKAFNTTFATTLIAGEVNGNPPASRRASSRCTWPCRSARRATAGPARSRSSPPDP
ncbi:hypothetical protein [Streptomyces aquilus]|uniref:hypothetical protein n=1 Tax=Streptomyces aquilus TaxID=2548456 RepID=UPI001FCB8291|nr:hypothetical protein [Streptomyces aquilus]